MKRVQSRALAWPQTPDWGESAPVRRAAGARSQTASARSVPTARASIETGSLGAFRRYEVRRMAPETRGASALTGWSAAERAQSAVAWFSAWWLSHPGWLSAGLGSTVEFRRGTGPGALQRGERRCWPPGHAQMSKNAFGRPRVRRRRASRASRAGEPRQRPPWSRRICRYPFPRRPISTCRVLRCR